MTNMRFASKQDVDNLLAFLGQVPICDTRIPDMYSQFMLLEEDDAIQAVIGYERAGNAALLRSLVFSPNVEQMQLLGFLETFLEQLHKRGIEDLYLVTNSKNAMPLFGLFGFKLVDKVRVPAGIASLEHFSGSVERGNSLILNCQLFTRISTN